MNLTKKDITKLIRVHPDLKRVVLHAATMTTVPFIILEGDRTLAQQKRNVIKGVSFTMHSRHLIAPSGLVYAVDVAPKIGAGPSWSWPLYYKLATIIKRAAADVGVKVEWGGDWKEKDGPHWQLPWREYPGK